MGVCVPVCASRLFLYSRKMFASFLYRLKLNCGLKTNLKIVKLLVSLLWLGCDEKSLKAFLIFSVHNWKWKWFQLLNFKELIPNVLHVDFFFFLTKTIIRVLSASVCKQKVNLLSFCFCVLLTLFQTLNIFFFSWFDYYNENIVSKHCYSRYFGLRLNNHCHNTGQLIIAVVFKMSRLIGT